MTLPARADVAIVGGGFAGAATAYALAGRGDLDVILLEREPGAGYHASGRNAALGRQLVEDSRFTDWTLRGAAFLRDPPLGFSDVPLWQPTGSMLLADSATELEGLRARADARAVACEALALEEVWERFPPVAGTPGAGGIFVPGDGVIDVHALLMGFLAGARRRGAAVELSCEVQALRPRAGGGLSVVTSRGKVAARCVVAAGGAWSARLARSAGAPDPGLAPVRRHLFTTEPIRDLDRDLPFVWHLGADEYYVRPEGGGLLLSGCDEAVTDPGDVAVDAEALEALAEKLSRVAPRLADLGIARAWACQRTFAPSRTPLIGWDEDIAGLFWVTGLGGHGATASPAIGADAAEAIAAGLL